MKEVGAGFPKQQKMPLQSHSFPYIHTDMQELVCVCLQTGLELAWEAWSCLGVKPSNLLSRVKG